METADEGLGKMVVIGADGCEVSGAARKGSGLAADWAVGDSVGCGGIIHDSHITPVVVKWRIDNTGVVHSPHD